MTLARSISWTLLLAGGFALLPLSLRGQQEPPLPKKDYSSGGPFDTVGFYRDKERGGIEANKLKTAREAFAKFAKYYADVVAHPAVYKAPQEFRPEGPNPQIPTIDEGPNGILRELNQYIRIPLPNQTQVGPNQADYIREFGLAFDTALKGLIETDPKPIDPKLNDPKLNVRINAARVLAHVCKTGAPAHFATVVALLNSPNVHASIKSYLFQAAGNLLAAYDPNELKTRLHVKYIDDAKMVGALVQTLEECITDPTKFMTFLPDKVDPANPEHAAVIGYIRRQAVRALAQTRFATIIGADGKTPRYPAYTLARVVLSDPSLVPPPGPAEIAEAVIGFCNVAPVTPEDPPQFIKEGYNSDAAVEVVAAGLLVVAEKRNNDTALKLLPWRAYALRLAEALHNWQPLFDRDYDITVRPTKYNRDAVPPLVKEMVPEMTLKILHPMEKVDVKGNPDPNAKVDVQWLDKRLTELRSKKDRNTLLFTNLKQTPIVFPPRKK